ncbi:prenyltransferase [Alkalilimnicola ehrlichii]|uniref:prenyltransferase n=1 Tax=Alkalilimnicola ehrlichii TaxID=351052 RepID=UPI003BA35949
MASGVLKGLVRAMRPPFLLLSPLCVLLGIATAVEVGVTLDPQLVTLVVLGALLAHAATNLLNEYHDFRSGLDLRTTRTPFSGGSGALPAQPAAAPAVLMAALAGVGLSIALGVYLTLQAGPGLLLVGLLGVVLMVAYTPLITRSALLCLIAPGLGFALIQIGTHYVLTARFNPELFWVALTPLCLVSALLLINQFPDVEADRVVHRGHLPIRLGRPRAARVFAVLVGGAYVAPVAAVGVGGLSAGLLLALLPMPVAGLVAARVMRLARRPQALTPWLGVNVAVVLTTLLLLALGLLLV